jgi:hypothetical protein
VRETGASSIEAVPVGGGVEVGGIPVLPVPCSSEGWLAFERNGRGAVIPDMRFGDNIHVPTQRTGGPDSYLKRLWIFVWMRVYMV